MDQCLVTKTSITLINEFKDSLTFDFEPDRVLINVSDEMDYPNGPTYFNIECIPALIASLHMFYVENNNL